MASSCRFSSTQATWGSTRVGWGEVPGGQEGHPPPTPQKDRFLCPGATSDSRAGPRHKTPHLLTAVCPLAGHSPSLSFTFLILKRREITPF